MGQVFTEKKRTGLREAVEKGRMASLLKRLPKGKIADQVRKGFEKWLRTKADKNLTDEEFKRAWNAEVKKWENFHDLPMDKAADLYIEDVEPLGEEMSYQGLIVYAKRALEGWDQAAGALETLRHTVPTTVSEDYVREVFKRVESMFGKALDGDRGSKLLEEFEVSAWKAKKAALGD